MKTILLLFFTICSITSVHAGRLYSADHGRWLNRDPIGVNGGINEYNSVSNNMVNGFTGLSFAETQDPINTNHANSLNITDYAVSFGVDSYGEDTKVFFWKPKRGQDFGHSAIQVTRENDVYYLSFWPKEAWNPNIGIKTIPGTFKTYEHDVKIEGGKPEVIDIKDLNEDKIIEYIIARKNLMKKVEEKNKEIRDYNKTNKTKKSLVMIKFGAFARVCTDDVRIGLRVGGLDIQTIFQKAFKRERYTTPPQTNPANILNTQQDVNDAVKKPRIINP